MAKNYKDDLLNTTWLGEVIDIEDPQKVGRIRVKVYGKFDELEKESIPWAYPGNNTTGGSNTGGGFHSVPKLGSIVSVKFDNGNIYHPEYFFNQKISNEVKSEISNSYPNSHVLIYDTVTEEFVKVFFTEKKGLMLDYKKSQINIKPDKSILIQTNSGKSKIEISDEGNITITQSQNVTVNCKTAKIVASTETNIESPSIKLGVGAVHALIKGDIFQALFDSHIHATPSGPSSPPLVPATPSVLSVVSKTI